MMTQRQLGAGGPMVSALGLGCMGMSEFYGPSDDALSLQTLVRALELEINFFDSADTYGLGHNERLLGQFIAAGGAERRRQMRVATKFGIVRSAGSYERRIDNSAGYIQAACDASLARLGIEQIDLYYCHRRDPAVPIEAVVESMAALVRAGKVSALGLSEVSPETLRRAAAVHPIAAVQSEYSLWSRGPEEGMLATCAELGTAFVAYSPLGRAFLTASVSSDKLAEGDFRKNNPRFQGDAELSNRALVEQLTAFSSARGLSNAQVALAWLLAKSPQVIPIPGTRRIAYLEQNAAATGINLSSDEMLLLDHLFLPEKIAGERYPMAGMLGVEA